ncbi:tail fiber protein [Methylobacterium sp. EM32]|uniref:phage tail protein n=1 Tax=Methylobacterium sp. EM32 TaxID=3163481 RepID=UPI0033BF2A2B
MDAMTGMIFTVPFDWAPQGWQKCQGQVLSIQQYQALFSLILNQYGGDINKGTFGLPNFSGRTAIGTGQPQGGATNYTIAQVYGTETAALTLNNLPPHTHAATFSPVSSSQNIAIPGQAGDQKVKMNALTTAVGTGAPSSTQMLANAGLTKIYGTPGAPPVTTALADAAITVTGTAATKDQTVAVNMVTGGTVTVDTAGSGTAFSTFQPSLALTFIITMTGLYPMKPN